jgi:hypothetical protein
MKQSELPGPVIKESPLNATHKRITCRLPGTPVQRDGSHEVILTVPRDMKVTVAGVTI